MKIGLKKYFDKNCHKNTELIGLEVVKLDGESVFINDFDQSIDSEQMPKSLFVSKKKGNEYGRFIDRDELYVEVD